MSLRSRTARRDATTVSCGCCASDLPRHKVAELGNTPGVYICRRCALWAIARTLRQ